MLSCCVAQKVLQCSSAVQWRFRPSKLLRDTKSVLTGGNKDRPAVRRALIPRHPPPLNTVSQNIPTQLYSNIQPDPAAPVFVKTVSGAVPVSCRVSGVTATAWRFSYLCSPGILTASAKGNHNDHNDLLG